MPWAAAVPPTYGTHFFFAFKKEVSKNALSILKRFYFFARKEVKQEKRDFAVGGGAAAGIIRHASAAKKWGLFAPHIYPASSAATQVADHIGSASVPSFHSGMDERALSVSPMVSTYISTGASTSWKKKLTLRYLVRVTSLSGISTLARV